MYICCDVLIIAYIQVSLQIWIEEYMNTIMKPNEHHIPKAKDQSICYGVSNQKIDPQLPN